MRKKYAREIRRGILLARKEWRARKENDLESLIESTWEMLKLEDLSLIAFNRSYRKNWKRGSQLTDQTEFKVGDKVKWLGYESYGTGEILGFGTSPSGYELVHLRMDKFTDYDDYTEYNLDTYGGLDFHETRTSSVQLIQTLAEKRADDFRILEEASRPWRSAPDYYKFPHDVQTTDISMHLNSNGGQAVGYISRSTRIDGQNKEEDPRESLRKAIDLIQMEIYRLDEKFGDTK